MRRFSHLPWIVASLLSLVISLPLAAQVQVEVTASSPHLANGQDASQVLVTVTDDSGAPLDGAEVVLDISPPFFTSQITQPVYHLRAAGLGNGVYAASFTSPVPGPYAVVAIEQASLAMGVAVVDFVSPYPATAPRRRGKRSDLKATADEVENCKKFFDKLDEEFYPPILDEKIRNETDPAKKKELEQRKKDVTDVISKAVALDIAIETKQAKGEKPTQAEKDALDKAIKDTKEALKRVSEGQKKLFEEFFGMPVDADKFQACTELFNNFKLVDDFDKAIERIRAGRPMGPKKKVVERGPDASIAHIRWAKFAKIAIGCDINADLWRKLAPTLAKGSAITADVLMDNDSTKPGMQPAMQKEEDIKKRRDEFDPLRPKDGDGEAERKKKLEDLEKKLIELLKKIAVDKKVIAMVPGSPGNYTVTVATAAPICTGNVKVAVAPFVNGVLSLERVGDGLLGMGVDNNGRSYLAMGTVRGSEARFTITGYGLSPTDDVSITAVTGTVMEGTISGEIEGLGEVYDQGRLEQCTWLGSFEARQAVKDPKPVPTEVRSPRN